MNRPRRSVAALLLVAAASSLALGRASASAPAADLPWCGPEVTELSDHVCVFDGGPASAGRRTLVIYLHGSLAATPGFQYVQQRMMAREARQRRFTVLLPTAPATAAGYWWPAGEALRQKEPAILEGIRRAREELATRLGARFDETFVVGFSSGAYYGSSLAVRSALDVDGYVVLAGGSSWMRPSDPSARRAPVFIGVSAADAQTAEHSRAFAGTLAALRWPYRVEERDVGHMVDDAFLAHGLAYIRQRLAAAADAGAPPSP